MTDWRINDEALSRARQQLACEVCYQRAKLDAAHVIPRGMGGRNRLDSRLVVLGCCRACHRLDHAGDADTKEKMRSRLCSKLRCTRRQWKAAVKFMLALPRNAEAARWEAGKGLARKRGRVRELIRDALEEMGLCA